MYCSLFLYLSPLWKDSIFDSYFSHINIYYNEYNHIYLYRLTSTSGTIFRIPLTKSCDVLASTHILWGSTTCIVVSFSPISGLEDGAEVWLLAHGVSGMFGCSSTALISSMFSSNWLEKKKGKIRDNHDTFQSNIKLLMSCRIIVFSQYLTR